MRKIRITATETIVYRRDFELDELEEFLGQDLDRDFGGDLQDFIGALQDEAHATTDSWVVTDLERHGDVQGQHWEGELIELPIGGSDPDGE